MAGHLADCSTRYEFYNLIFVNIKFQTNVGPAFGSVQIISNTETLDIERIPFVNRCSKIVCDVKGRNFFALQHQPTINMRQHPEKMKSTFRQSMNEFFEQAVIVERDDQYDEFLDPCDFSDLVLVFKDHRFKVHKFIMASRSLILFHCVKPTDSFLI